MNRLLVAVLVVAVLAIALDGIGYAVTGIANPVVLLELAEVRMATAKYRDVNAALADGFVSQGECFQDPQLGVMGIHYVNEQRMASPSIDMLRPAMLLYVKNNGRMELVGVEYFHGIGAADALVPEPAPPAPVVFNQEFNGPMLGHWHGQSPHYDLHVWIWKRNPSGLFAQYNPAVKCQ